MESKKTHINLADYTYELADEKIAKYPLAERDQSKLLHYKKGSITHEKFRDIIELIPKESTLFFNNTKVIPARLIFNKATGAQIEIFLLKPIAPSEILSIVMEEINGGEVVLKAKVVDRDKKSIQFEWDNQDISFAEIVEVSGKVPLPPYLNRAAEESDKPRYQTVYSQHDGAVAAPTAGLHFTSEILEKLKEKGVKESFLTLHVSAGTFQPIKSDNILEHPMHSEQMVVTKESIQDELRLRVKCLP
jgi:S-adenosylmethionine:tRNA ribosyltransferase-isomerase